MIETNFKNFGKDIKKVLIVVNYNLMLVISLC